MRQHDRPSELSRKTAWSRSCVRRATGRRRSWCVRTPPAQWHSTRTASLSPWTVTTTRSSISRAIACRSTADVLGAVQSAGMSEASCLIAACSSAVSGSGCAARNRSCSAFRWISSASAVSQALLQATHHQSVLRLDGIILAPRPLGLVAPPLQSLSPLQMQSTALQFEILCQLQADLQGGRRQRLQHQCRHQGIERASTQRLTSWGTVVHCQTRAAVALEPPAIRIEGRHTLATTAANHQTGQEGRTTPRDALVCTAIGRHLIEVPFVGLPADVGRQTSLEQDRRVANTPACPGLARSLLARIHPTTSIGIGARIKRALQHFRERIAVGNMPLQLAFTGPSATTKWQPDIMGDEI